MLCENEMYVKERTRKEIEARIESMGDYMQMGYLAGCLKNPLDFDTRKFVLTKLSGLYESKKMFLDAAKMLKIAADINTTYQAKIIDFVKACELFLRAGDHEQVDLCMKMALGVANEKQKLEIKRTIKEFYKMWGKFYIESGKKKQAIETYEKLWHFGLSDDEKSEVRDELMKIYKELGKIREYDTWKNRN